MKNQFIKVHDFRGKDNVPGHIAAMNGWVSTSANTGGSGNHHSTLIVDQDAVEQWAVVDQDTVEQRVVYQPQFAQQYQKRFQASKGGNGAGNNPASLAVRALMQGPVSPNESGLTHQSMLYANGPLSKAPQVLSPQPSPQPGGQYSTGLFAPPYGQPASFAPQSQPLPSPARVPNMPLMSVPGFPAAQAYRQYQLPQQVMVGPPSYAPYMPPPRPPIVPGGKRGKKRRFPVWVRTVVGVLLFLTLIGSGGYAYYYFNFSKPINDITNQPAPYLKGDDNPNQNLNGDILSGPRINILLLGSDTDQKFGMAAGGATVYLAQTDIVVSIDPATKQVAMLSIPRDFYINIPGYGMGKLDEAFSHGYSLGPGGFPGAVALSRLTIFQDFGIPINYYAWVGLDGFVKVIDTVGGVDVDVLHPITDDAYPDDVGNKTGDIYAYKRLYIAPGPQHLSGGEALEYVRSRHADLVGDFGRSARQQQVLSALKTKLVNPDIIGKLSQIANDLDGYVKTDMQLPDVLKLMNFARGLDPNKVQRVILDSPYSSVTTLPNGESIVEPNCSAIVPEIARVFQLGNQARCNITASSNNSMLASSPSPGVPNMKASADIQRSAGLGIQFASSSSLSLFAGSQGDNMLGYHSILDLLFAVVFESPQAMQV